MPRQLDMPDHHSRLATSAREIRRLQRRHPTGHKLYASWSSEMPTAAGVIGAKWRVPYVDGRAKVFAVTRISLRLETAGTSTTTVQVESSPGGGAFSATTVAQVSCASGVYENATTGTELAQVQSGDILRVNFLAVGTGADDYAVQLEGIQIGTVD